MSIHISLLGGLLALALLAPPAAAQTVYKSTLPDGKVIYGDKPAPGAIKVEESKPDTSTKGIVPPTDREKAVLKKMESDRKTRAGAQDRVRRAEIALHDAEVARDMGKEPQPNERLGTAKGGTRFTDGYWERQKKLEEAVDLARRNLEQVRAGK